MIVTPAPPVQPVHFSVPETFRSPSVIQYVPGDRSTVPPTVNPSEICMGPESVKLPLLNVLPGITQGPPYVVPLIVQPPEVGILLVRKVWVRHGGLAQVPNAFGA